VKKFITAFLLVIAGALIDSADALVFVGSVTYNNGSGAPGQWGTPQIFAAPSGNIFATTYGGDLAQFWIGKFDENFNFLSDANFPAAALNTVFPVIVNGQGDLLVAGSIVPDDGMMWDIWIAKYDDSLLLKASSTFAGGGLYSPTRGTTSYQDVPNGIAVGADDEIFLTGHINCCGGYGGIGWTGAYGSDLTLLSSATFKGPYLHPQYDDAYPGIGDGFAITTATGSYTYVAGNIYDIQSDGRTFWLC